MTAVAVRGWSVLSSAGVGAAPLAARLAAARVGAVDPGGPVGGLHAEPLPAGTGHALADFDVRARLGRKGTSFYDRTTALAVVACHEALAAGGMTVDDGNRARIGLVLGTTLGSFRSTSDFSRETLVQDKPYLVNPVLFPNTVMNCAAGQAAIRFGLRGVNATIAGGQVAFLQAVRYAVNAIDRGYADVMLAGAVEEFSPHRAWASHLTGGTATVAAGEGAAVFALSADLAPAWAGGRRDARILSVCTGFGSGSAGPRAAALEGCVRRAVRLAGVDPARIGTVLTGEVDGDDDAELRPVTRALGHQPRVLMPKRQLGECDAAAGALALAVALAEPDPAPGLVLLTAAGADGAVAAAVVERCGDAGVDRE